MIISRTPMRISFAGGGTDFADYYLESGGAVISTAINKYIYITVNRKFDDLIRVSYSSTEIVDSVDNVQHNIIREALKLTNIIKGIEVVYMGDIPLGTAGIGLGSSSSLAVGILNALHAYKGEHVSADRLAREACEIEINILKNPIGKQDQYIAAYGGLQHIRFNRDDTVFVDPIICKEDTKRKLKAKLMLFYTGITRVSSTILSEQKAKTKINKEYLDKIHLLSKEMHQCIIENHFEMVSELLDRGWSLKRNLASGISTSEIDTYYAKALDAGAKGGKLLGAGGGGFLLFYCEAEKQNNVRKALKELKEVPFLFEPQGSKIIYVSDCDQSHSI